MRLFPRLRRPKPVEEKTSRGYTLHITNHTSPVWSAPTYRGYATEGYSQNVIAAQAVNKIASAVSTIRWRAQRDGKIIDEHPVLDLIRRPNSIQSSAEWWRSRIIYLLLAGNNYDERVRVNGRVRELWVLRPDRMTIKPSSTGLPAAYIYKVGGSETVFHTDPVSGDGDINHTKLFHPLDDWYGLSPFAPASYAIDQHNESMRWMQALLQNAARPSGALTVDSEIAISEEQLNRLKAEIEEQYSGAGNAGRPLLLEGGLEWQEMGLSPEKMEISTTKDSAARDISLALGVPPLLLNIPGDNTYSNYREARLGFFEDTVIPLVNFVLQDLNMWLKSDFDAEIVPDLDSIEALAEKRRGMWEMVDNSDELTVNEARRLKGFPELPGPQGNMLLAELRSSTRGHDTLEGDSEDGA